MKKPFTLNDYINELRVRLEKIQGFVPERNLDSGRLNNKVKTSIKKIKQTDHEVR